MPFVVLLLPSPAQLQGSASRIFTVKPSGMLGGRPHGRVAGPVDCDLRDSLILVLVHTRLRKSHRDRPLSVPVGCSSSFCSDKQILERFLRRNLSFQVVGWALQTQLSYGFKKSHRFSVCPACSCLKNKCDNSSAFYTLEVKLEVAIAVFVTMSIPTLTRR